jgi:hypothetical protein
VLFRSPPLDINEELMKKYRPLLEKMIIDR